MLNIFKLLKPINYVKKKEEWSFDMITIKFGQICSAIYFINIYKVMCCGCCYSSYGFIQRIIYIILWFIFIQIMEFTLSHEYATARDGNNRRAKRSKRGRKVSVWVYLLVVIGRGRYCYILGWRKTHFLNTILVLLESTEEKKSHMTLVCVRSVNI